MCTPRSAGGRSRPAERVDRKRRRTDREDRPNVRVVERKERVEGGRQDTYKGRVRRKVGRKKENLFA